MERAGCAWVLLPADPAVATGVALIVPGSPGIRTILVEFSRAELAGHITHEPLSQGTESQQWHPVAGATGPVIALEA